MARKAKRARKAEQSEEQARRTAKDRSVKALIPYDAILSNGVAYLGGDEWSISLLISDVNYLISTEEHQMEILNKWAKFLDTFDSTARLQVLVLNRMLSSALVADQLALKPKGDGFDPLREDYDRVVRDKLMTMSRNTVTSKLVTVTVRDPDKERGLLAVQRLAMSAESQLNQIDGCKVTRLDRTARLRMLSAAYRGEAPFAFRERQFEDERTSTKDYVAPWAIDLTDPKTLKLVNQDGDIWHRSLWIRDYPPELSDRLIGKLTELRASIAVSIHFSPHSRGDGLDLVKRKVAELDMQIVTERRRNIKQHLPADEISAELADSKEQATALRDELQHSNQHLIDSMLVIGVSAASEDELDGHVKDVLQICRQESCTAESLSYMQLEGLSAELPLGVNQLPMSRTLTTSSAAILIPFTTQEAFEPTGTWYGTNARSGNALAVDRTLLMNQNGFTLGTTGSGKSQENKLEMLTTFLKSGDDMIVVDPEHEYTPLCEAIHGTEVEISASSSQMLNPMDIVLDNAGDGNPVRAKAVSVLSMIGALIGGTTGLEPAAKGLLDRCIIGLYAELQSDPGRPQPTLHDLRDRLLALNEPMGEQIALELEMYTEGSLSGFSGHTNVNLDNRFVNFDVSGLDGELRTFGMMVVLDAVWNRVLRNRQAGKRTWLWIDEFHRFFGNEYAAKQFLDIYKRGRKYGLGVTGITQNIEELLENNEARLMLSNSDFLVLMNQNASDADTLSELMRLSPEQRAFFTGVNAGQGLIKVGSAWIPFDGRMPTDSSIYRMFTTKFGESA
ncbi:MAG: hypothetical protein ABF532_09180 [Bifidobacterium sp.]|uniref:VirB4-like conjugal transfer ATPase, CD1110 family n=1 Tax=Bifidobacterium sp. TaxID=41200 RepID=UPI0039EAEBFE